MVDDKRAEQRSDGNGGRDGQPRDEGKEDPRSEHVHVLDREAGIEEHERAGNGIAGRVIEDINESHQDSYGNGIAGESSRGTTIDRANREVSTLPTTAAPAGVDQSQSGGAEMNDETRMESSASETLSIGIDGQRNRQGPREEGRNSYSDHHSNNNAQTADTAPASFRVTGTNSVSVFPGSGNSKDINPRRGSIQGVQSQTALSLTAAQQPQLPQSSYSINNYSPSSSSTLARRLSNIDPLDRRRSSIIPVPPVPIPPSSSVAGPSRSNQASIASGSSGPSVHWEQYRSPNPTPSSSRQSFSASQPPNLRRIFSNYSEKSSFSAASSKVDESLPITPEANPRMEAESRVEFPWSSSSVSGSGRKLSGNEAGLLGTGKGLPFGYDPKASNNNPTNPSALRPYPSSYPADHKSVAAAAALSSMHQPPSQSKHILTPAINPHASSTHIHSHPSAHNQPRPPLIQQHSELTTKGRKRKRLAKACSACHKNKRRCDGFAPCSNCEFSSRTCVYLNSAGEAIPPPRSREETRAMEASGMYGGESSYRNSMYGEDIKGYHSEHMTPRPAHGTPFDRESSARPSGFGGFDGQRRDFDIGKDIDLSWEAEADAQKRYDELEAARKLAESEWQEDKEAWLDCRQQEWEEAKGKDSGGATTAAAGDNHSAGGSSRAGSVAAGGGGYNGQSGSNGNGFSSGNGNGNDRRQSGGGSERDLEETRRRRERDEAWYTAVVERIDSDDILVEELCHQFFARMHPYQLMFHQPTFNYRRYLSTIPPALLHIIYAFASRFTDHRIFVPPSVIECEGVHKFPVYARGEVLAARAKQETDAWLRAAGIARGDNAADGIARRHRDPSSKTSWEDTEMVQAICLISTYEQCMGRSSRSAQYLDIAIEMLKGNVGQPATQNVLPHEDPHTAHQRSMTLTECRTRTFWMLYMQDVYASANGKTRKLRDAELVGTNLPGQEAVWNRSGGYHTNRRKATFGTIGGLEGYDVGEFGHVIRILSVFSEIMDMSNKGVQVSEKSPLALESALRAWAASLPVNLRFDEANFVASLNKLASPVPFLSASGFCFAMAHALAESSQFYLQSSAARAGDVDSTVTAVRQSQAVDNLSVILDTIGDIGRHSPQMFFPLHIVSNWIEHTTSHLPAGRTPSPASVATAEKLNRWWADLYTIWGVESKPHGKGSQSSKSSSPARSTREHPAPLQPPRNSTQSSSGKHSPPGTSGHSAKYRHAAMLPPPTVNGSSSSRPSGNTLPPLRIATSQYDNDRLPSIAQPRKISDLLDSSNALPSPLSRTGSYSAISPPSASTVSHARSQVSQLTREREHDRYTGSNNEPDINIIDVDERGFKRRKVERRESDRGYVEDRYSDRSPNHAFGSPKHTFEIKQEPDYSNPIANHSPHQHHRVGGNMGGLGALLSAVEQTSR